VGIRSFILAGLTAGRTTEDGKVRQTVTFGLPTARSDSYKTFTRDVYDRIQEGKLIGSSIVVARKATPVS